jgi:hypothetical protein
MMYQPVPRATTTTKAMPATIRGFLEGAEGCCCGSLMLSPGKTMLEWNGSALFGSRPEALSNTLFPR